MENCNLSKTVIILVSFGFILAQSAWHKVQGMKLMLFQEVTLLCLFSAVHIIEF